MDRLIAKLFQCFVGLQLPTIYHLHHIAPCACMRVRMRARGYDASWPQVLETVPQPSRTKTPGSAELTQYLWSQAFFRVLKHEQ